jgi:formamidopyrimidine-DNA glycosylase
LPELPEVETVCQGLNQLTLDQKIVDGEVLLKRTLAHPSFVEDFLNLLNAKVIVEWHRRGKYLLAQLQDFNTHTEAGWLGVHLRMTGQLLWVEQDLPVHNHTRVRLFFSNQKELRFVDQRTFGQMWAMPAQIDPAQIITGLQQLGPEPFWPEFNPTYLAQKFQGRQRSVKTALLDQSLVAGVGNIYADEALFLARIPPTTLCKDLNQSQVQRLHAAVIQVLRNSIEAGGTTFSNFLNVKGINGNYGGVAWVYNRAGEPCRVCHTPIERLKLAGRSAHFCPQCQP